jgi:K(+)-stimulated pyrophosphate-energized sodium pump
MLLIWLSIAAALVALGFAGFLFWQLSRVKIADEKVKIVSNYIRKGAKTFLLKEYSALGVFVVIVAIILFAMSAFSWQLVLTFLIGAGLAVLGSFISMKTATLANAVTVDGCKKSLRTGMRIAFSASSIVGYVMAALGVLGVTVLYVIFKDIEVLYGLAFGASLVALFIRIGGGVFTKAADIGADSVGKMEANISEDDPRNPAVVADSVGDNVGDVAGVGADLFESYVGALVAAVVLGLTFLPLFGLRAVSFPLFLAGLGLIASILGGVFVMFNKKGKVKTTFGLGLPIVSVLMIIFMLLAAFFALGSFKMFGAAVIGLVAGALIGLIIYYYTSINQKPVKIVAKASQSGAATNIISGIAIGFFSTIVPVVIVVLTIGSSYYLAGIYGVAIAAVGVLSVVGISLTMSAYGPVVDNASSIARMSGAGSEVRERTEKLDAMGNTGAAISKGYTIFSATLTALALLIVFGKMTGLAEVNLVSIKVISGLLFGALLPFIFSALSMRSVGIAAEKMIKEVRRQLQNGGIVSGQEEPKYNRCVKISTNAALGQMIWPGALAILVPIIIGLTMGASALAGLLAGAIVTGFILAVFMANAGGIWDNAKKAIESGLYGGPGSDTHKASVVGDMVGDSLKDVAGPALNILIKLMVIVSVIIVPLLMS